jgi:neural cell adhesion molecule L1, putative
VVSYVNISEVKIEDGGEYECKADNGVAVIHHSSRINVIGPPSVRPMKNMTIVAGEVFRITCPVSGYPIEDIAWERGKYFINIF